MLFLQTDEEDIILLKKRMDKCNKTYKYIENFNYAKIIGLPKVLRSTYHYGITRFRIGSVKTLNEASELCAKAKKNVLRDAFVIVIY